VRQPVDRIHGSLQALTERHLYRSSEPRRKMPRQGVVVTLRKPLNTGTGQFQRQGIRYSQLERRFGLCVNGR
jgi:hypothetical protein